MTSPAEPRPRNLRVARQALERALCSAAGGSLPMFTFHETMNLFRQQYVRAVKERKEQRDLSWADIESEVGVSRAALLRNEERPRPTPHGGAYRFLLSTIQDAGEAGVALAELMRAFYETFPKPEEEEAQRTLQPERILAVLVDDGDIEARSGRYFAAKLEVESYDLAVKRLIMAVQSRDRKWRTRAWMAHRYYAGVERVHDVPGMESVLERLVAIGVLESENDRFRSAEDVARLDVRGGLSPESVNTIEQAVSHIGQLAVAPSSSPDAGLFHLHVQIPGGPGEVRAFGERVIDAIQREMNLVGERLEDDEPTQFLTMVVALGPGII